jgi:phosphoribosylanthranilate isomerase
VRTPPRVKICGVTRVEDAMLAVALGAAAVGFICWEGSPRYIKPRDIRSITRRLPAFVSRVGVFVNAPARHVRDVAAAAGLTAVQLHGDEVIEEFAIVGLPLVKLVHPTGDAGLEAALALPDMVTPIVDASDSERHGGTGRLADWHGAARLAAERPIVLAGGLRAENVADAARQVRPWAVDVSSGVESAPGVKSPERLRALFAAVASFSTEDA